MQGFRLSQDIKLTYKVEDVLKALRENLDKHRVIVEEAKEGYRVAAREALLERREAVKNGAKLNLSFNFQKPTSHIATHEAMISMLEFCTEETIELTMEQQQAFMEDRWDWQSNFMGISAAYSKTARG